MKLCTNCGQPIQEDNSKNPIEILSEIQGTSTGEVDDENLCQVCKEELGMLNLMGFGV